MKEYPKDCVAEKETTYFRKGVENLLHMIRWSIPELYNSVRDLSKKMNGYTKDHIKEMYCVTKYVVSTPTRERKLKPDIKWDGKNRNFKFKIKEISDSYFAVCKYTRISVKGYSVIKENTPVTVKSYIQKNVALLVTKAEFMA